MILNFSINFRSFLFLHIHRTVGGKPHKVTYDYASSLLKNLINSKSEFTNSNIGNV